MAPAEIDIQKMPPGGERDQETGMFRPPLVQPFMPKSIRDAYHPSGNSLCYMIQTAHLMGCDPIYCVGFTLQTGTGYFFGRKNPVLGRTTIYDHNRAFDWLRWYGAKYGRAVLWPGFQGPVYDVMETLDAEEATKLAEAKPALSRG